MQDVTSFGNLRKPNGYFVVTDDLGNTTEFHSAQCKHCLAGDTKVLTDRGIVCLRDVVVGDLVLDKDGALSRVNEVFQRTVNRYYRIVVRGGGEDLLASAEHPLLVLEVEHPRAHAYAPTKGEGYTRIARRCYIRRSPYFKQAVDIRPGDYVAMQTVRAEQRPGELAGQRIDKELARFIGLYLAEGWTGRDTVELGFHQRETTYHSFIKRVARERFHANCREIAYENSLTHKIVIYSSRLEEAFKVFGHGAEQKHLPMSFLSYPPAIQREIIRGIYEGDGMVVHRRPGRVSFKTISFQLAYQVAFILLRLGHNPCLTTAGPRVDDAGVSHRRTYEVNYSSHNGEVKSIKRHIEYGGYWWLKVMKNAKIDGELPVYNLSVAHSETFVANLLVTHNCGMHWQVIPGSGRQRGWCMRCMGLTCGSKKCRECVPMEAQLEIMEGNKRTIGRYKHTKLLEQYAHLPIIGGK
mgnify:CR=1 FL=1